MISDTFLPASLSQAARDACVDALQSGSAIKIKRASAELARLPEKERGVDFPVYFLPTFNLESIQHCLEFGLRLIPSNPRISLAPLDSVAAEILNSSSEVYRGRQQVNVILWRLEELCPEMFFPSIHPPAFIREKLESSIRLLNSLAEAYDRHAQVPLFVATLPIPHSVASRVFNSQQDTGVSAALARLNFEIFRLAGRFKKWRVLDLHEWAGREGSRLYDLRMDLFARQPFSSISAVSLGCFIGRTLRPHLIPRRKVLAVDLDNTLWGGILGEDGVPGLALGSDFPGNIFSRIQRELLELRNRGVLLVLVSKNGEAEVKQAFSDLPGMILRWSDFVAHKVNYDHKFQAISKVAEDLGLGISAFAFLDDSDYEREQMASFHPDILILNRRGDPIHMLESLLHTDAFESYLLSEEDQNRHREYELRTARNVEGHGDKLHDFLKSLELRATLEQIGDKNLERVVQMLGKTNQFNLTTRRHKHDEVRRMMAQPGSIGLTLQLEDKFGNQGIVALILAVPENQETLRIDSFLVSCRALSRGVEEVLWSATVAKALETGFSRIEAQYIPTERNQLVANVYNSWGLVPSTGSPERVDYTMHPIQSRPMPDWIEVVFS